MGRHTAAHSVSNPRKFPLSNPKTIVLLLTCAIAIAGEVMRAGSLVEVTIDEARDLLARGKAVPHDPDVVAPILDPDQGTARAEGIAIVQEAGGSPAVDDAAAGIVAGEGHPADVLPPAFAEIGRAHV